MIIESKGRISNISSLAGIVSPPAYFSNNPKEHYLAVTERRHAAGMIRNVFKNLAELSSSGQPFSLSRDELIMMLDEALSRSADN